ncbi:MAG: bifunctional [glutamate--ammonia ligase]-adenylyl-L-tyrosine phosphorylase/[glutamate--ammonia-ligase] adenylyltransferase [SAR86 cluster bacterium]|uniref:Bifunctional glutamine synthetase adenylyltransferase/adenylyl-removing enzyme n=1 Tax=SAR86 cluster bacterium TaxID=2030880 RepID=A0A2A4MS96_9GAMM|nr:MAG: bifunctional [glutamate--ammonia ligase]-adenylyl-L-tyrosine phosphorylase/[glutamate--ammonia-ligase] adenylyltransferase [SAR86 cluster bacterium]
MSSQIFTTEIQTLVDKFWRRLQESSTYSASSIPKILSDNSNLTEQLSLLFATSDFVADSIIQDPTLLIDVTKLIDTSGYQSELYGRLEAELAELFQQDYQSIDKLKSVLRLFHRRQFISIIWQDICGESTIQHVCAQMSELAEHCLQQSLIILQHWCETQWGQPQALLGEPQTLIIIGMGKLGARELNVSSDIDLIFAYPDSGELVKQIDLNPLQDTDNQPRTHQQFFTRLAQRLIDVIDTVTENGFLFRVDMRLRPYGSEGALVLSGDALEDYYQNQGRDWERYALIKARVVAGDQAAGNSLLNRLQPFIYRRYLDFAMLESLRDMKRQIQKQVRRKPIDSDIKLGSGGIREIEFIVQAMQLVHGGKDRLLQEPSLFKVVARLIEGEYLPTEKLEELLSAYDYLRRLEHRLQALSNQQTQTLPTDLLKRQRIALAMEHSNWQELESSLQRHRDNVTAFFEAVIHNGEKQDEVSVVDENCEGIWLQQFELNEALELLTQWGFEDGESSLKIIDTFRRDRKYLLLASKSRARIDRVMPLVLAQLREVKSPNLCLQRIMPLIEAVSRRTAYLVLLIENPRALSQLVHYCHESPFISEYLIKFPVLLDELLDVIDEPPEKFSLYEELKLQLLRIAEDKNDSENFSEQLECLRYFKQSHILKIAAAEVSKNMPLMMVSDYLTFIAETILEQVLLICWDRLVAKYGFPVHSSGSFGEAEFIIVAYGKLGGYELSYNSDLDLVFIHQADLSKDTIVSASQKSINSREFYIRLAQKIISMLGTYTLSGKLYEIDMRLRPSGESGLLVSSIESFADYQQEKAWTWEHQALVRARAVVGNKALQGKYLEVRKKILAIARNRSDLAGDILSMRNKMRNELSSDSSVLAKRQAFALKQGRGGVVDIEFLVQFLVLAYAHKCTELLTFTDNFRILEAAIKGQLIAVDDGQALIDAYLTLRSASHQLALEQSSANTSIARLQPHMNGVAKIWDSIFADHMPANSSDDSN